ncbi:MAG: hypothetical protein D6681_19895 [Calditrichaeota bacterium]|nr:MAG: hypothetical protein D6681_19895 [Calditrichota bacterium]
MKFLCVECDEAMQLQETRGPEDGSMTVIFVCPKCDRRMAMLTNPMETQMVRALDVQIGGKKETAPPMGTVRSALSEKRADLPPAEASGSPETADNAGSSGCPFTGMVEEAIRKQETAAEGPVWTPEAEARLQRIPSFVRGMVKKSIEQHAREKGYTEITAGVLEEIKAQLGM